MKISKIEKEYLKKIKLFQEYNKYYYDKSDPKVTDNEFDILKKEIIELERKYSFLKSEKKLKLNKKIGKKIKVKKPYENFFSIKKIDTQLIQKRVRKLNPITPTNLET